MHGQKNVKNKWFLISTIVTLTTHIGNLLLSKAVLSNCKMTIYGVLRDSSQNQKFIFLQCPKTFLGQISLLLNG